MSHPFRPSVERLADRLCPVAGWPVDVEQVFTPDDSGPPTVHLLDRQTGRTTTLTAYDPTFRGGVRTALADVTGDGRPDIITAAGAGGGPHVKVFDGETGAEVRSFYAFHEQFTGGVEVAGGDVNRDGYDDIITGAGAGGGPHVKVFDGRTGAELASFFAFEPSFTGGAFLAAGDVNRDGYDDVITGAGPSGGPRVRVWDLHAGTELADFFPFDTRFRGGVRVASGDLNADGVDDIITSAGPGGGPHVRAIDPRTATVLSDRFVADASHTGGVRVAVVADERGNGTIVTRTRSGDLDRAVSYGVGTADRRHDVWVGDITPPDDLILSEVSPPPVPAGGVTPVRTVEGRVSAVAADGKSMTVVRGDGSAVVIDLDGDDPPPPGLVYIDFVQLPPAEILLGDVAVPATAITAGRWVRATVARAWHLSDGPFTATRVRLL